VTTDRTHTLKSLASNAANAENSYTLAYQKTNQQKLAAASWRTIAFSLSLIHI